VIDHVTYLGHAMVRLMVPPASARADAGACCRTPVTRWARARRPVSAFAAADRAARAAITREIHLVIDAHDPDRLAEFWSAALGYEIAAGVAQYRSLRDPEGVGPKLLIQGVPEVKAGKNRLHLDIAASDLEAEAERLVALGATRIREDPVEEFGISILLADPEGNEVCVVPEG
jgi:predicted enzyme related to lactoylglutathione lyase